MKFLLYAPDYTEKSAGVTVMHTLCDMLNKGGYPSTVTSAIKNSKFTYDASAYHKDSIAIIPDIAYYSQVKKIHKYVVRYALNYPNFFGVGDPDYKDEPCVFTYAKQFYPAGKVFYINVINSINFWENKNFKRTINSFYIGKGAGKIDVEMNNAIEITSVFPYDRRDLRHILQVSENFYSFDDNTALLAEANLCGAKSHIRKDNQWIPFETAKESTLETDKIEDFISHIKTIYTDIE